MFNTILRVLKWLAEEAWEKINVVATYRELKALGKKHGPRFFIFAFIWEVIEDVVFPILSWLFGVPQLIPFFLVMHFEPIVYPAAFWFFRMYDRLCGRVPWEPDRSAQSSYWRSMSKVAIYNVAAAGWYMTILMDLGFSAKILMAYFGLMTAFGFIHERMWADANYGIDENDHVQSKRIFAKTFTYGVVSTTVLSSLSRVSFGVTPWKTVLICQGAGLLMYLAFEAIWAKNTWGITPVLKSDTSRAS